MTVHVNEFVAASTREINGVQRDARKLKFNNIQSCIAIGFVPFSGTGLIGVHLTMFSTQSANELKIALDRVKLYLNGSKCDAYLVATWNNHLNSQLRELLKNFSDKVYLCDVDPKTISKASGVSNTDIDVKMERSGNRIFAYVREHVHLKLNANGEVILKPKYNSQAGVPKDFLKSGKSAYLNDRDDKPWQHVDFYSI